MLVVGRYEIAEGDVASFDVSHKVADDGVEGEVALSGDKIGLHALPVEIVTQLPRLRFGLLGGRG